MSAHFIEITSIYHNKKVTKKVPLGSKLEDLLPPCQEGQPVAVAALINNQLKDLRYPVFCDSTIEWLDYTHTIGNRIFKQSLSFLLFVACQKLYPNHILKVLHSLGNGRYCELQGETPLTATDYQTIEQEMQRLIDADLPIAKANLTKEDSVAFLRSCNDIVKAETLLLSKTPCLPIYTLEDHSQNLFSKLVPSTGYLDNFSIQPFDEGFVLMEPNRYFGKQNKEKPFAFPKQLQVTLKDYASWHSLLGMETAYDINNAIEEGDFSNLIIMAESMQQRAMLRIADAIHNDFPQVKVVLIAGPSSSGKTTFTNRLGIELRTLGLKPIVLSLDNYFLDRDKTPLDEHGKPDFEGINALDLPYFNRQLVQMIAGEKVELPIYDFKSGSRSEKTIPVQLSERHILLIEGIHGINEALTNAVPANQKRKIFISCLTELNLDNLCPVSSSDNRELRRMVRDLQFRGTLPEKTLLTWRDVRDGEEKNIFPYQESADFFFNSSLIYEMPVLRPLVEEHLKNISRESPAYAEARRLLKLIQCFRPIAPTMVPAYSLLQEFLGGSCFEQ